MNDKTHLTKLSRHEDPDPLIAWHCRRGVLELDALLIPFFEQEGSNLTNDELNTLSDLVKETDHTLTAWLLGKSLPNLDPKRKALIKKIRAFPTK